MLLMLLLLDRLLRGLLAHQTPNRLTLIHDRWLHGRLTLAVDLGGLGLTDQTGDRLMFPRCDHRMITLHLHAVDGGLFDRRVLHFAKPASTWGTVATHQPHNRLLRLDTAG